MDRNEELVKGLAAYRLRNQLTQAMLAKKLNVGRVTLNRWLNALQCPRPLERYRIKELLKKR
jgi:DNA-binding XRE family transcriptional regulator